MVETIAAVVQSDRKPLEEVLPLLRAAFTEGDVGGTGLLLDGHLAESRKGKHETDAGEVNFLYGELLPKAVSVALDRLRANDGGTILELGMGTGKVAMQAFLQCPNARRVVGVELSSARYEMAVAAANKLAANHGDQFSSNAADTLALTALLQGGESQGISRGHILQEVASQRCLWLLEGDLVALGCPGGPVEEDGRAIFMNLRLPPSARLRAYPVLQRAPDGCRVLSLENFTWEWLLPEPAVFHAMDERYVLGETDLYPTSWCEEGYPYYTFHVDRCRRPSITAESATDAVHDLYSQGFF